jgi:hypothetical protein
MKVYHSPAMRLGVPAILIGLFFLVMQGFVLPPDGFMTGDQGSKYLQTRAFAQHGPLDPSIDVRARDIDPSFAHQEPKLKNRRGRLVSEFMWLLPLLGAPFLAVFGLRGLYVVPGLSAVAVFVCAARLARRREDPYGAITGAIVLLVTPIAYYGLEIWEHAPAAACVMIGALLLSPADGGRVDGRSRERLRMFAAGAAVTCGFLFREETAVVLPALLLGRALARDGGRWTDLAVTGFWSGVGALVALVASMPMNLMMYGAALPMHLTQDAWEYAKNVSYLSVRHDIVTLLFMPAEYPWVYAAALIAGLAASVYASHADVRRPGLHTRRDAALVVVHLAVAVMLGIGVGLPLARLASGAAIHEAYMVTSAAHTWAFAPALLYLPWLGSGDRTPHARYLIVSAVMALLFTSLVVPSTAGAQWSPRFYLQIAPLLAIPAAEVGARRSEDVRRGALWGARAALVASMLMLATGFVNIYVAKTRFAAVTHGLARVTVDGEVIISDVFWVPEVTSTLAPSRRFLFSWSASDFPALAALGVRAGLPRFTLVTYAVQTQYLAPDSIAVPGAPCRFVRGREFGLEIGGLVLSRYRCE